VVNELHNKVRGEIILNIYSIRNKRIHMHTHTHTSQRRQTG